MRTFLDPEGRWFKAVVTSLCVVLVALAALLDYSATAGFSPVLLYLLPISLAAWYGYTWTGPVVAFLCAAAWLGSGILNGSWQANNTLFYTNAVQTLTLFAVAAIWLIALRRVLGRERVTARTDYLTGAPNARAFHERIEQEVAAQRRYLRPLTLAYVDADNFKLVNDRFGHSAGDDVLRVVFACIKKNIRATDFAARMGGDEFTLLLPDTGREAAQVLARRLVNRLNEEMRQGGWPTTFSVGMVTCLSAPPSADDLIKEADRMMYQVKNKGKNAVRHELFNAPSTRRLEEWDQAEDRSA